MSYTFLINQNGKTHLNDYMLFFVDSSSPQNFVFVTVNSKRFKKQKLAHTTDESAALKTIRCNVRASRILAQTIPNLTSNTSD